MKFKANTNPSRIRQQLLLTFLFVGILPVLVLGIFSIIRARKQMDEHYRDLVKADGLRINSVLFDITTTQYTSTESFTDTQSCMLLFGSGYKNREALRELSDLDERLETFHHNTAAVSSLRIYTDNPQIPTMNHIIYVPDLSSMEWYQKAEDTWSTWTCLAASDTVGNTYQELALVRRLGVVSDRYSAYLVVCLDNNYLKNRIEQSDNQVMISVDALPVFYASDRKLIGQSMTFPDGFSGGFCTYTGKLLSGRNAPLSHIATFTPYKTDNYFYICTSDDSAFSSMDHLTLIYLLIMALAILIPSALILYYSSFLSSRIATLKTAMHKARMGDYNIIDPVRGDDELQDIFEDLKATVEMIHEKEARYYEAQINRQQMINRQQQMEFKMLASQINPHFLYNTLETIRMQALAQGNRDVATSIKLLGKSMHYVLENTGTSFTTLTKELDYIKTYLAIQKLRFGDRVNVSFQIPEDLDTDEYKILPLLLQPIVENAIIHGLENVDQEGHLTLAVKKESEDLVISITDNGDGMTEEAADLLRRQIAEHDPDDTRSIGLYNINQRIHLFYGESYGLSLQTVLHKGTTVTLHLPGDFQKNLAEEIFHERNSESNGK